MSSAPTATTRPAPDRAASAVFRGDRDIRPDRDRDRSEVEVSQGGRVALQRARHVATRRTGRQVEVEVRRLRSRQLTVDGGRRQAPSRDVVDHRAASVDWSRSRSLRRARQISDRVASSDRPSVAAISRPLNPWAASIRAVRASTDNSRGPRGSPGASRPAGPRRAAVPCVDRPTVRGTGLPRTGGVLRRSPFAATRWSHARGWSVVRPRRSSSIRRTNVSPTMSSAAWARVRARGRTSRAPGGARRRAPARFAHDLRRVAGPRRGATDRQRHRRPVCVEVVHGKGTRGVAICCRVAVGRAHVFRMRLHPPTGVVGARPKRVASGGDAHDPRQRPVHRVRGGRDRTAAGVPARRDHGRSSGLRAHLQALPAAFGCTCRTRAVTAAPGGTPARGIDTADLVGDVRAFVDALGLDTFHLVGFSMGAMTGAARRGRMARAGADARGHRDQPGP